MAVRRLFMRKCNFEDYNDTKENKMYYIYLFDIMNKQEDYAKCLQVVEFIQKKRPKEDIDKGFWNNIGYMISEYKTPFWKIDSYSKVKSYNELPIATNEDEIRYVFQVDCSCDNDMVNLFYY